MKELLMYLVKSLVEKPDEVLLDSSEENDTVRFKLKVSDSDKGKIIGKNGKVIKAIRTVVSAEASTNNKKMFIDVE